MEWLTDIFKKSPQSAKDEIDDKFAEFTLRTGQFVEVHRVRVKHILNSKHDDPERMSVNLITQVVTIDGRKLSIAEVLDMEMSVMMKLNEMLGRQLTQDINRLKEL